MRLPLRYGGMLVATACAAAEHDSARPDAAPAWTLVTVNTGTTPGLGHDDDPTDGYTSDQAAVSDEWYGDGLAWLPAVDAMEAWLAAARPDVVAFQEVFDPSECEGIPDDAKVGFVCETWSPGDPTVAEQVLGPGYTVRCHPGRGDKCVGVRDGFGELAPLEGWPVDGCGSGARVARGVITRSDGDVTVVSMHGSSGVSGEEQGCRVAQIDQIFVDLGDGSPGVSGLRNVVLGDFNTDPHRFAGFDASAQRLAEVVGDSTPFAWLTPVGPDAPGSYGGLADIDHIASDVDFSAVDCGYGGLGDVPAVLDVTYFDHRPALCVVQP